ncbi:uncharacterized protein L203_101585 [Cryptococcus depauperatus CBS 7841]|uniref:Uncharacterized protein n=1 Tax=Cryptococcus depauperatus CBS 7841 TaxID=1295531 RepID=A0A1E3IT58_9TREE|nr:hypothetical protein L203_01048 [Cryptococcus depauperatus CBS 7841]
MKNIKLFASTFRSNLCISTKSPLRPQSTLAIHAIPKITPTHISRQTLERLHKLSALAPPPPDSLEEKQLIKELSELIGLMDLVKQVELPQEAIPGLLGEGIGAVRVGEAKQEMKGTAGDEATWQGEKHGKDLLEWSPTRIGDYYSSAWLKKDEGCSNV